MYKPFSAEALAHAFRAGDSRRFKVDLKNNRGVTIEAALKIANGQIQRFAPVHKIVVKGRQCVSLSDYSQILIMRILSKYISRRFRVESSNRDRIVKHVIEALSDSTPIYIIRRDISSFYETLPIERIRRRLTHNIFMPSSVVDHLNGYFKTFCDEKQFGLPRGITLSAILAELAMEEFDKKVRKLEGVYRYFRYSDDIVIFSFRPIDALEKKLEELLPHGMKFNANKSASVDAACLIKNLAKDVSFEYLGYKYRFTNFCDTKSARAIEVEVSDRKLSKLKTRIICALKAYKNDRKFDLLMDRLRFLSGNYLVYRKGISSYKTSKFVKSGIYYNYRWCGLYGGKGSEKSKFGSIKSLDAFFQSLIRSSKDFSSLFNDSQRAKLVRLSFFKGFQLRLMVNYPVDRVQAIKRIWNNV